MKGEQAVLDLVPLAGAGWQMGQRDLQAGLIGEALQFAASITSPGARCCRRIRRDVRHLASTGFDLTTAIFTEPVPMELTTMIGGNVVDAIRRHLAEFWDLEIYAPGPVRDPSDGATRGRYS